MHPSFHRADPINTVTRFLGFLDWVRQFDLINVVGVLFEVLD
jgi:hypothetical protein